MDANTAPRPDPIRDSENAQLPLPTRQFPVYHSLTRSPFQSAAPRLHASTSLLTRPHITSHLHQHHQPASSPPSTPQPQPQPPPPMQQPHHAQPSTSAPHATVHPQSQPQPHYTHALQKPLALPQQSSQQQQPQTMTQQQQQQQTQPPRQQQHLTQQQQQQLNQQERHQHLNQQQQQQLQQHQLQHQQLQHQQLQQYERQQLQQQHFHDRQQLLQHQQQHLQQQQQHQQPQQQQTQQHQQLQQPQQMQAQPQHHQQSQQQPEPFPNSKSLPFPISPTLPSPLPPPPTTPSSIPQHPLHQLPGTPPQPSNTIRAPLYNIAKLHAANCTILHGKVYNDKGHNICGVLNQHEKPCRRIGKCPFHGYSTPVSADNSCNGLVDASGTAVASPGSPDGTPPPSGLPNSLGLFDTVSAPGGTTVSSARCAPPKKMQIKHGWTKEEHFLFLGGLEMHGKGSWKQIASVVKSRTPTQVQSHAQKYFLRQKQNNKNKRSIHDLSMDSPEMRDLEKRCRNGDFPGRSAVHNLGLGENIHVSALPENLGEKFREVGSNPLAQSLLHNAQNVGLISTGYSDSNRNRFRSGIGTGMGSRFLSGQAMSATTLASSLSSGVPISQVQGAQNRSPFQPTSQLLPQQDLFVQASAAQGINSLSQRKMNDSALGRPLGRLDTPQPREVHMSAARPAFPQEALQQNAVQSLGAPHALSPKGSQFQRPVEPVSMPQSNERNGEVTLDQGSTQQPFSSNGFHGLYPSQNATNQIFNQPRAGAEGTAFPWTYDNDVKPKRGRENSMTGKDTMNLQNSFPNIGALPISEAFGNASGVAQDQPDTNFDPGQPTNPTGFSSGIFGGADSVEVGDCNVYGVGAPGSMPITPVGMNVRDFGAPIHGFAGSTGMQIGSLTTRGTVGLANQSYVRN